MSKNGFLPQTWPFSLVYPMVRGNRTDPAQNGHQIRVSNEIFMRNDVFHSFLGRTFIQRPIVAPVSTLQSSCCTRFSKNEILQMWLKTFPGQYLENRASERKKVKS